jgi:hypothetical protein
MENFNTYYLRSEMDYRADRVRQSWRPVTRRRGLVRRLRGAERDH